jgi:hypothetical protein
MTRSAAINFLPLELRMVEKGQKIVNDNIVTCMSLISRLPININQYENKHIDHRYVYEELSSKLRNVADRIELIHNVNNDPEVELNIEYEHSCPAITITDEDLRFARKYFPSNACDVNVLRDLYGATIFSIHTDDQFIYLYIGIGVEIKAETSHINHMKLKNPRLFNGSDIYEKYFHYFMRSQQTELILVK